MKKDHNIAELRNEIFLGLPVFLIPLLSFLSPMNLKQLVDRQIIHISFSLVFLFIFLFIIYYVTNFLLLKIWSKRIYGLFLIFCFGFYLLFLHEPIADHIKSFLQIGFFGSRFFAVIFLAIFWIVILYIASIYNKFVVRLIFIFSILMLSNSLISIVGFLNDKEIYEKENKYQVKQQANKNSISKEKHRNIYFILLDEMTSVAEATNLGILDSSRAINKIEKTGLRYIRKSLSSYNLSYLTLASIFDINYPVTPKDPIYFDRSLFFPSQLFNKTYQVPLIKYLNQVNSSLYWVGNSWASCIESEKWDCISTSFSTHFLTFYRSTPFDKLYFQLLGDKVFSQDAIKVFLKSISTKGLPNKPFFAFIHHFSPHQPYSFTKSCEPADPFKVGISGYKDSYHCALKRVNDFMDIINTLDPEGIVIFQGDHGWYEKTSDPNEKILRRGKIFNAIKAPNLCFEKFGEPRTNVNTIRFALNCSYGFNFPFLSENHYQAFYEAEPNYGTVIKQKIY